MSFLKRILCKMHSSLRKNRPMRRPVQVWVGDTMLIFFGDPETKGDAEDAKGTLKPK